MNNPVLEVEKLCKNYGSVRAVRGVSFSLFRGEKVALLGSNGAGKTSLINMITGLRKPSSGRVEVFQKKPFLTNVKSQMTYLPQELDYPMNLKVKEIIQLVEAHFPSSMSISLVDELEMKSLLHRKASQLSGGEKRKLGVICSLMSQPDFVVLDEPTANIDVEGQKKIEEILKRYCEDKKKTLLFSSHQMKEVESLAERIIVMKQGKIIAEGTTTKIKKQFGLKKIKFQSQKKVQVPSARSYQQEGEWKTLFGENSDKMLKELIEQDKDVHKIQICEPQLDEVLVNLWSDQTKVKGERPPCL